MFTGLIEAVGNVMEMKPTAVGFRLRVETPLSRELSPGDSIAVNGVCLTVITALADEVCADISPETAHLGAYEPACSTCARPCEPGMRPDRQVRRSNGGTGRSEYATTSAIDDALMKIHGTAVYEFNNKEQAPCL